MQSGAICTATLITPDTVLTAAHCFWTNGKNQDKPDIFLAGKHKKRVIAKYQATQVTMHFAFAKGLRYKGRDVYISLKAAPLDVAMVKVRLLSGTAPIPLPVFRGNKADLSRLLQENKWRVTQAGYAGDRDDVLTAHRQCRITHINQNLTLYHQCDTLSGNSGSPMWASVNNQPQIVAVQSSAPDVENRD
ncbi:trypsin-like serine peptidase, partial [Parachlamydia acanthamoebae]